MNAFAFSYAIVFSMVFSAYAGPKQMTDSEKLNKIITTQTEFLKRFDPFSAPYFNVEEDLDKFGEYPSESLRGRMKAALQSALKELKSVKVEKLEAKDRLAYDLFKEDTELSLKSFEFPMEYLEFSQMGNRLRNYIDQADPKISGFPFDTVKHYEAFLKRSEGFPAYIDRQIAHFRKGIKNKITLSALVIPKVVASYEEALEPTPEKNPFFKPISVLPKTIGEEDRKRLTAEFKKMVVERIVPGFQKFDQFFKTEYQSHCHKNFGIGKLPNGAKLYAHTIKSETNLALAADAIHEIGLKEVARINSERDAVQKELGYSGTRKEFLAAIRSDAKFYFKSSEELFIEFKKVKAKIAKEIPKYFSLTPKSDYEVVETSNAADAVATYRSPTEMRPEGRFVINGKNLRGIPVYGVTTLSMHEAVPGHHFQLALQFEMKDKLSEYQRKIYFSNAFAEGWALYAEYLGREMGMFKDPVQRLGHLDDEMLRAVRLVVDTGIHAKGWTRQQAIDYMTENLAADAQDIENEVDRYAVLPAQALGYKLGQLKILELRKLAEGELGSQFDIREFHRVVIGNGTVSLGVLDNEVKSWIASQKRTPAQADL